MDNDVTLTDDQALELIARIAREERLLDIVMPNGKKLSKCTGNYVANIGKALQKMNLGTEAHSGLPDRSVLR